MRPSSFGNPEGVIRRGTVGERAQLHGSLGSTEQYQRAVQRGDNHRGKEGSAIEGVPFLPYQQAMHVVRQADDEITLRYESEGRVREKGFFLESLRDEVAEQFDEWLLSMSLITEEDGAFTEVIPRNALQTALDVYHGVDAFLDIRLGDHFQATVTFDVTANTEKLDGTVAHKADFVVPLLEFSGGKKPSDPKEAQAWLHARAEAREYITELSRSIIGTLWRSGGLERAITSWVEQKNAPARSRRRVAY